MGLSEGERERGAESCGGSSASKEKELK